MTPDDHAANDNSARRRVTQPVTLDDRTANDNSAHRRATRPRSTTNDRPEMRSAPLEHPCSFHSSHLSQPPIPAANHNSGSPSCQDHSEFWGLYKPAQTDPSQDSTATHSRVNSSGFGLSSPALQQPSTKPFSGLPSRRLMASPYREAGEAERERPGIVYPLLPRAARPDTRVTIDAALPGSCRPQSPIQATHGAGHSRDQSAREFAAFKNACRQAAIPQTPSQSLGWSIPAVKTLASTRPLVRIGSTIFINK